jgi:hypothetical protein
MLRLDASLQSALRRHCERFFATSLPLLTDPAPDLGPYNDDIDCRWMMGDGRTAWNPHLPIRNPKPAGLTGR